jgi:hypothetical protein
MIKYQSHIRNQWGHFKVASLIGKFSWCHFRHIKYRIQALVYNMTLNVQKEEKKVCIYLQTQVTIQENFSGLL